MTKWPLWRLLVCIEVWLFGVAVWHAWRPIHEQFIVPLLVAVVPSIVIVGMWVFARGATDQRPSGAERANVVELSIATIVAIAAAGWVLAWALQARADLQRLTSLFGQATIIVDVSLTWLSVGACLAALTLDSLLAAVHPRVQAAMKWLRRTHVTVTVLHLAALFGSAWFITQLPDTGTAANAAAFDQARIALHVYEYSKATVFPVQAFFAAMSVALLTADHYAD